MEQVGSFIWPFKRYDVLMPQQIQTDLFEWLYLSLVVHQNEQRLLHKDSYTNEVKEEVRKIIKQKFSSFLDDVTIDNIVIAAEKDFIVSTTKTYAGDLAEKSLSKKTFSFLETYEDLFGSQVKVQRVFQDAICNGVVPCFKEMDYIKDADKEDVLRIKPIIKEKPSQNQIKEAYILYNKMSSCDDLHQDDILDEDEFVDEDAEIDFVPDFSEDESSKQEHDLPLQSCFSVHYIDNTECDYKLEIPVYSNGEKLYIGTPFDVNSTSKWLNKRLGKARTVSSELDDYLTKLETEYTEQKASSTINEPSAFIYRKGVADQLTYCSEIYRMIEHLPAEYDDLKKILIDVDKQFASKHKSYFNSLGSYLECLIHRFVDYSDADSRLYFDYGQYCSEITYICGQLGVYARPLFSDNIFKNWQKAWDHFKANLANLFIANSKMRTNKKVYKLFIQDAFDLYDSRNNGSHYKPGIKYQYNESDIDKLTKITRVLIELI